MLGYINDFCDDSIFQDINNFRVTWCDNLIWVTNYIKIIEYTKQIVKLKVKNNVLIIEGFNINIRMLEKKEIVLKGRFNNVYLEKMFKAEEKNEKRI